MAINVGDSAPDFTLTTLGAEGPELVTLSEKTAGTKTVLLLSVIAFLFGRPDFLDLALAYALINFVGVLAVLEFFQKRSQQSDYEEVDDGASR